MQANQPNTARVETEPGKSDDERHSSDGPGEGEEKESMCEMLMNPRRTWREMSCMKKVAFVSYVVLMLAALAFVAFRYEQMMRNQCLTAIDNKWFVNIESKTRGDAYY